MTDCCLRLNIHDDCDFGMNEFGKLVSITHKEFYNKNELNKKLREKIETMDIQIDCIEQNKDSVIVNVNVKPI